MEINKTIEFIADDLFKHYKASKAMPEKLKMADLLLKYTERITELKGVEDPEIMITVDYGDSEKTE